MTNRQTYRHTDRDYYLAGKVSYVYIDIKLFLYFPFPCLGKSFNPFMSLKLIRDRFIILKTFFFYNYPEMKISHNNVIKIIPHSLLTFQDSRHQQGSSIFSFFLGKNFTFEKTAISKNYLFFFLQPGFQGAFRPLLNCS